MAKEKKTPKATEKKPAKKEPKKASKPVARIDAIKEAKTMEELVKAIGKSKLMPDEKAAVRQQRANISRSAKKK